MRAFACSALGCEGIAAVFVPNERGMDEQRLPKRPGKSVCKHQRIVQTEVAHVIVAFQFTATKRKVFVGMEQTTELALQVADVKLIPPEGKMSTRVMPLPVSISLISSVSSGEKGSKSLVTMSCKSRSLGVLSTLKGSNDCMSDPSIGVASSKTTLISCSAMLK